MIFSGLSFLKYKVPLNDSFKYGCFIPIRVPSGKVFTKSLNYLNSPDWLYKPSDIAFLFLSSTINTIEDI